MNFLRMCIQNLIDNDAVHRKGFCISHATPTLAASSVAEEIGEVLVELELLNIDPTRTRDNLKKEVADVMASLVHLMMLLNLDFDDVEGTAIEKLDERFTWSQNDEG